MPLKPRPNAAATMNSPVSLCVSRNAAVATAWQAEPANTACNPPNRSANQPHSWRLKNAQPSNTDSIAAPCAGAIPTSLQNATRWFCGTAIGMQQQNPAADKMANNALGGNPSRSRRLRPGGLYSEP